MISGAVPIIKNFRRSNFRSKHMENNACARIIAISLPAARLGPSDMHDGYLLVIRGYYREI